METTILGWIWNNGNITVGSHKITPLAKCEPPTTATKLRSLIISYKVLNQVLRGCAQHFSHLDEALVGK